MKTTLSKNHTNKKLTANHLTKLLLCAGLIMNCSMNLSHAFYLDYDLTSNNNFDFDYGSWTGDITPGPAFITIGTSSATTSGGAGFNVGSIDITPTNPNNYIRISARLQPGHNGSDIRLVLASGATDFNVWAAPATLFNTTTFTTVDILLSTPPVFTSGTFDPTNITSFQIQGDFFSPGDFRIEVERMQLIPEPHHVTLLGLVILLAGLPLVKRKLQQNR